ncbi:MAG: ABC transporter ATP-binding protein [Thermotaleaceae bacterium]
MNKLELIGISKKFQDKTVLKDVHFTVHEGEMVSLLGPSGCGKTTILKVIAGLLQPDKGEIVLSGQSIGDIAVEKRGIVMVFQDYLLFPHLNVWQNIGFGLKMAGKKKKEREKKIKEMLELVELVDYENHYPRELSGGQKQRVALARALAIEPKVLLLDEPFSNLDARLRENMRSFVRKIQKKLGITTLLVTHDKEEAFLLSDKIIVILDGKIEQIGTPKELYIHPHTMKIANFLGKKNYIHGKINKGYFHCSLGSFSVSREDIEEVVAMIRPEEIKLTLSEQKTKKGKVIDARFGGDRIYYTVEINGMLLESADNPEQVIQIDDSVNVDINFKQIVFLKE